MFGGVALYRVHANGQREPVALHGRPLKLLAYLAAHGPKMHSRAELAATLWSEQTAAPSAASFNNVLWRLRQAVEAAPLRTGDVLQCDRDGRIALNLNGPWRCELQDLQACLQPALGKAGAEWSDADVALVERGVTLGRGEFLAGMDDDWALRERERLARLQHNALSRLMQLHAQRGQWQAAIKHAQQLLDVDPLREDIHRHLMRWLHDSGQRAKALMQFEACRQTLKRELAIAPMRETMELYHAIAQSAVANSPATVLGLAAALPCGAPSAAAAEQAAVADGAASDDLLNRALQHVANADAQLRLALPLFQRAQLCARI